MKHNTTQTEICIINLTTDMLLNLTQSAANVANNQIHKCPAIAKCNSILFWAVMEYILHSGCVLKCQVNNGRPHTHTRTHITLTDVCVCGKDTFLNHPM